MIYKSFGRSVVRRKRAGGGRPNEPGGVGAHGADIMVGTVGSKNVELIAVVTIEAVGRSNPKVAAGILHYAVDRGVRQTVFKSDMREPRFVHRTADNKRYEYDEYR